MITTNVNFKHFTPIILIALFVAGCNAPIVCQDCINRVPDAPVFTTFTPLRSSPSAVAPIPEGEYEVVRVLDGDTLIIKCNDDKEHRVRLIGIDAPEVRPMQPYGQEAKDFVEQMIDLANGYVRLQFDGDGTDRSGRIRAHIHLTIDGNDVWLNELLVRQGYAVSMLGFRHSDGSKKMLVQAELYARQTRMGMWALDDPPFP